MIQHSAISDQGLKSKIKNREVLFGGNSRLKIYGKLNCKSGKRMKRENRVFFASQKDALVKNFRPCGHCMRMEYKKWKDGII